MRTVLALFLVLASTGYARKEKSEQNEIVEKRNIPLGTTTFMPRKTHMVHGAGGKLLGYGLRIIPFATQNLDGSDASTGIRVQVYVMFERLVFIQAAVVLLVDGNRLSLGALDWTAGTGFHNAVVETVITEPHLVRRIAYAKEVYLTVLVPGWSEPGNQMSFQLSEEQRTDCRLIAYKFEAKL
jgi:hypothetical protein